MFKEFMIEDVIRMIGGRTALNSRELIRGISIDSRRTRPGELFFALKGTRADGHRYTKEAILKGAAACVVEKGSGAESEIVVDDTLYALGELARNYRRSFQPITIGITGTNGKTTVKNLVAAILQKRFRVLRTRKNYNSLIGLPLTVVDLSKDVDYLVLEMGTSSPGEIERLCNIARPSIGVITNIGPGHLQGLGSLEGVRKEKLSLIYALPDDGFGLVGDGIGAVSKKNVFRFARDMVGDVRIGEDGSHFTCRGVDFYTPLLGLGNIDNCLAALCLTSRVGVDTQFQITALAEMRPEPGRMEPIRQDRLLIINDSYNSNPASLEAAVNFVAGLKRRKVFILGDMLELGAQSRDLHARIGDYVRDHCEVLLTYGTDAKFFGGQYFRDKIELLRYLRRNLEGDEVVLIKASRALRFEDIVGSLTRWL
jgi:UDP-N-acetylmuramoyl-tripeptide--D-alanyl-D-alanine ligase